MSRESIREFRRRATVENQDDRDGLKYVRAVARSLHPIRFGIGGLYYLEREAKLTLMNFLVTGTGNLLIAFKQI